MSPAVTIAANVSPLLPSSPPLIAPNPPSGVSSTVDHVETKCDTEFSDNEQGLKDAIAEVKKLTMQVTPLIPRHVRSHILRGPEGWAASPPDLSEVCFSRGDRPLSSEAIFECYSNVKYERKKRVFG